VQRQDGAEHRLKHSKKSLPDFRDLRRQDAGIVFWGTLPALPVGGVQRQDGAEHRLKHSKKSLPDFLERWSSG
jgi:hypothetical protein